MVVVEKEGTRINKTMKWYAYNIYMAMKFCISVGQKCMDYSFAKNGSHAQIKSLNVSPSVYYIGM